MVGARVRRPQVAYARARGLSGRRACALLSVARSTLGYQSRLVDRDAPALAAMRRLAAQYPRYGYRRIRIFLKREGHTMSTDRTHRLWRQAGLQVPRRRPRRRVALSRPRPVPATAVNHVWAYDFVFDTCANGQTLKCLTVVDEWTRESLAIDVAGGIRSGRVIEVLTQLVSVHGAPRYLRSDNGPEFVAGTILRWLLQAQIETALIEPGKPWQNATDESFNGKFRDEYLSLQWFRNRVDAKVGIKEPDTIEFLPHLQTPSISFCRTSMVAPRRTFSSRPPQTLKSLVSWAWKRTTCADSGSTVKVKIQLSAVTCFSNSVARDLG